MNIGIVGATGMVGQTFLNLLENQNFPVTSLKLFASKKKEGNSILFRSKKWTLTYLKEGCFDNLDIVFFSAGDDISLEWAPKAAKAQAIVIDNSAAFRMRKDIPLVVPEINANSIKKEHKIIANPNCSTIQLVVALNSLHNKFTLKSLHVSTYQSVSGAGNTALNLLKTQSQNILNNKQSLNLASDEKSIAFNCIPQIGTFNEEGFSTEEVKLMNETKKILNLPDLKITATAVRVPTFNGHGESVIMTFQKSASLSQFIDTLKTQPGLQVLTGEHLPHNRFIDGKNDVYVTRIRSVAETHQKSWMMWVATDNIRKGAALNSLQIAETLIKQNH